MTGSRRRPPVHLFTLRGEGPGEGVNLLRTFMSIEAAFRRIREELGIRCGFPEEVQREAEQAARRGTGGWGADRRDLRELPFVTIDPPGSRDLDQALFIERTDAGYRVWYAIADVGAFVARGSSIEAEAWLRGLTFYAPDHREPLYPPVLSQGAASLLPAEDRPSVVFELELDERGALVSTKLQRAVVRSRVQLTYTQALQQVESGELFAGEPFAPTLALLREVGEHRLTLERERGGVSFPIRDQHVQQQSALRLGYELVYEVPNAAEGWNAQISLLAGNAAAQRMLEIGRGLLRVMAAPRPEDVVRFRIAAATLGFAWPEDVPYTEFIHGLDPAHPNIEPLIWQARRLMRGADYIAFDGPLPEHFRHAALAMPYAHCTAPLRRLADRYVLDLLVEQRPGEPPTPEVGPLPQLPGLMDEAERKAGQLERRVVDIAEAWVLREHLHRRLAAVVLNVHREYVDVQLPEPPVRARVAVRQDTPPLSLGQGVEVEVVEVVPEEGRVQLELWSGTGG